MRGFLPDTRSQRSVGVIRVGTSSDLRRCKPLPEQDGGKRTAAEELGAVDGRVCRPRPGFRYVLALRRRRLRLPRLLAVGGAGIFESVGAVSALVRKKSPHTKVIVSTWTFDTPPAGEAQARRRRKRVARRAIAQSMTMIFRRVQSLDKSDEAVPKGHAPVPRWRK